jgi:competence protein ComEA
VRLSSRSSDDADVIRARLRVLLAEAVPPGGWLPDDDLGNDGAPSFPAPEGEPEAADVRLPEGIGRHRAPGAAVRLDPGRRGAWSLWAAGLIAALVLVAWTWLDRPRVQPVSGTPVPTSSAGAGHASSAPPAPSVGEAAETSATVVVSVVGRVRSPGLVTLPTGARVADAIAAAGGLLPGTDGSSVNLAAVVSDGEQVAVGVPGAAGGAAPTSAGPAGPPEKVNLNSATVADLDGLPGIGPVLAQRIIDYRDQQGPFASVDQLDDVPGIGPAIFAQLTKLVTV